MIYLPFRFDLFLMYALRASSLCFKSCAFRSTFKQISSIRSNTSVSQQPALRDRMGIKRRSSRFLRNYLLANGLLVGAGVYYYYFHMTPKERRQTKVTFEGIQRAFRFVTGNKSVMMKRLFVFRWIDRSGLEWPLLSIINTYSGRFPTPIQDTKKS